jgi:hypothetical protein
VSRARLLLAAVLASACLPALPTPADATETATLSATLTPEHLGEGTTIGFGFRIAAPDHKAPAPLTEISLRYPNNLGIALSGLGLATCSAQGLLVLGHLGCPPNSLMGYGTAIAEIPLGPVIVHETAQVTIYRAPTSDGHYALLIDAISQSPVDADILLPGLLLPAPNPFGGGISITVPAVPSIPEAPNVAVVQLNATLGPRHILYYEQLHGKTVAYRPKGILLPDTCPRGGFPFAAELGFEDGSHTRAKTTVPCPRTVNAARPRS